MRSTKEALEYYMTLKKTKGGMKKTIQGQRIVGTRPSMSMPDRYPFREVINLKPCYGSIEKILSLNQMRLVIIGHCRGVSRSGNGFNNYRNNFLSSPPISHYESDETFTYNLFLYIVSEYGRIHRQNYLYSARELASYLICYKLGLHKRHLDNRILHTLSLQYGNSNTDLFEISLLVDKICGEQYQGDLFSRFNSTVQHDNSNTGFAPHHGIRYSRVDLTVEYNSCSVSPILPSLID